MNAITIPSNLKIAIFNVTYNHPVWGSKEKAQ